MAKPISADAALTAQAREAVSALMKDPSSAQFKEIRVVVDGRGHRKVCGMVNAKNSYGGYVGFESFAFDGDTAMLASDPARLNWRIVSDGC